MLYIVLTFIVTHYGHTVCVMKWQIGVLHFILIKYHYILKIFQNSLISTYISKFLFCVNEIIKVVISATLRVNNIDVVESSLSWLTLYKTNIFHFAMHKNILIFLYSQQHAGYSDKWDADRRPRMGKRYLISDCL